VQQKRLEREKVSEARQKDWETRRNNLICARCGKKAYDGQELIHFHSIRGDVVCSRCFKCGHCGKQLTNEMYGQGGSPDAWFYFCGNCGLYAN